MLIRATKYSKGVIPYFILPVLVAGSLWFCAKNTAYFIPLAALFILILSWLVVRLQFQLYLFKLLALFLPFSIEIPFGAGAKILFPGEILVGIAALTLLIEIIPEPKSFVNYFKGEVLFAVPLVLIYIATILFSTIPSVSVKFVLINTTYILVFLIIMKCHFNKYPKLFSQMIILYSLSFSMVILYATFRFWQYGLNPVTTKGIFLPFYKDHTITGASAAMLSAYWLAGVFSPKRPASRLLMTMAGLFFLYAVFLTHSRAAILSLMFCGFVWLILRLKIHFRYLVLISTVVLLIAGIFHRQLYDTLYYNKYVSRKQQVEWSEFIKSAGNVTTDDSNVERLNRWYAGIKMFMEKPLTGFGPGTYQFTYIPFQKKELNNRLTVKNPYKIPENSGGTAHSEYILALSEMGLPGFFALTLLLSRWIGLVFIKARHHSERKYLIIIFASLSTYLFHAFFNNFLNTDKFAFLFWGMAAYLLAVYESGRDIKKETTHDKKLLQGS
jgi:putative inorganic carbon (hco3(-)) transporter